MSETSTTGRIETRDDLTGKPDSKEHEYWMRQTDLADKEDKEYRRWAMRGIKRYRAEGRFAAEQQRPGKASAKQEMNMFWSNIQLLRPAIYSRTPKPDVQRRWKQRDPVSRLASMIIERGLTYYCDIGKFGDIVGQCVDDRLIIGRGVMRLLYVPHWSEDEVGSEAEEPSAAGATDEATGGPSEEAQDEAANPQRKKKAKALAPPPAPAQGEQDESEQTPPDQEPPEEEQPEAAPAEPQNRVVYEELIWVHVSWDDYQEGPATTWKTVPWIRYAVRMTREKLVTRFGSKGKKVQLDASPKEHQKDDGERKDVPTIFEEATVWEIWDRDNKEVIWMAPGTPGLILDRADDPMELPGFYPQPEPLQATMTTDRRQPVSDYCICYDQYIALDEVTRRIALLTRALKVAGAYAGDEKATMQQLLDGKLENTLIPVRNWAQFMTDKGGLDKLISWLPIDMVSKVLIQLYDVREKIKEEIAELTGVGDIMRGMSDPRETSEAQSIKAGFGTLRMSAYQNGVQRFARDAIELMAAAMAAHVEPPVLSLISGLPDLQTVPEVPPQPQMPQPPPQQLMLPPPGPPGGPGAGAPPPGVAPPGPAALPAPGASPPGPPPAAPSAAPPAAPAGLPVPAGAAPGGPAPAGPDASGQPAQPPPDPAMQQYQQDMQAWQQAVQQAQAIQGANTKAYQAFMAAVQLIRAEALHAFSVDVDTDSMKAVDQADDQQQRTTFLQTIFPILQQVLPLVKGDPEMATLTKELVMLGVRGFPIARSVEGAIEEAFDAIANKQGPDPNATPPSAQDDLIKAQAQAKETDSRIQVALINAGVQQQKTAAEIQMQQARLKGDQLEQAANFGLKQQSQQGEEQFRQQRAEALRMRMVHGMGAA